MNPLLLLALKGLAGGIGVVLFALVGEVVTPKKFAGLFGAAPSVALASLLVSVADKGPQIGSLASLGMVVGAAGMVAFSVAAARLVARLGAAWGSAASILAWFAVAGPLGLLLLR